MREIMRKKGEGENAWLHRTIERTALGSARERGYQGRATLTKNDSQNRKIESRYHISILNSHV